MTRIRYRPRQRFAPGVSVSDWTATASCPICNRQHIRYRMAPERDGFYMITAECGRNREDHIAIVRTFALAKATVIQAAIFAAVTCDCCFSSALAQAVDNSLRTPSNTGFSSHGETKRYAKASRKGGQA